MSDKRSDSQRRRLRLEVDDLECSVNGLNIRMELCTSEVGKHQVEREARKANLEELMKQRSQLQTEDSKHKKFRDKLQANVEKLSKQLDRLLSSAVPVNELERIDLGFNEPATTATTDESVEEDSPFEDLTKITPWPTNEILENTWAKLTDRFLLRFACPGGVAGFLDMSWREVLSCPENDAALFRRECLWRTTLDARLLLGTEQDARAAASPSQPARDSDQLMLDPNLPLCPFEMVGKCDDPECKHQHTNSRPTGSVLPRELVVLPELQLTMKKPTRKKLSTEKAKDPSNRVGFSEEDYVSLPETDLGKSIIEADGPMFPWMEKNQRQGTSSLYDLLGITLECDTQKKQSYIDMKPGSPLQLFTSYQFALHNGRRDLAAGVIDAYNELNSVDIYSELLEMQQKTLLRDGKRNMFTRLFDAQLNATLAYAVAEYESQNGDFSGEAEALVKKIKARCFLNAPKGKSDETSDQSVGNRIATEWKKARREEVNRGGFLEGLIEKCDKSLAIRNDIQYEGSLDDVNFAILTTAGMAVGVPGANPRQNDFIATWPLLTVLPVFAQAIFGALGCAARYFDEASTNSNAQLLQTVETIDRMLGNFRKRFHDIFQTDLLLAPLYAANISLAATIREYGKVQIWLERLLRDHSTIDSRVSRHLAGTMMPYSDLLWSQIIQLRGALPNRLPLFQITKKALPKEYIEDSKTIEQAILKLGVVPCHVVLRNDSNIVRIIRKKQSAPCSSVESRAAVSSFLRLHDRLQYASLETPRHTDLLKLSFTGQPLNSIECYVPTSSLKYSIPQSILLAGGILESLNLSVTELEQLHPTFGLYFPNLKFLDLSGNNLVSLPLSFGYLKSLQRLYADRNRLECLPSVRLDNLEILQASANQIIFVPEELGGCKKLTTVDLSGNPLDSRSFSTLLSRLPVLKNFKPELVQASTLRSSLKRTAGSKSKPPKKVRFRNLEDDKGDYEE